jgi:hypothetical protein
MIVIHPPSFDELLHVAKNLRGDDVKELSATRNLAQPTWLATSAHAAKYKRIAYFDNEPVFAFGMSMIKPGLGQAWGFGTEKSHLVTRTVTKFIRKTMVPEMLSMGLTAAQAIGHPDNQVSRRWLSHLGFREIANLSGIGAGGQDLILWVTTADEHSHTRIARAA